MTPDAIKKSGRLRVYIQANIHAGEVEGKEAVLALMRDIARGTHADWMKSMVLLVNPIYNADGNERVSLTSRGLQHGPIGGQGTRPNAQGLNINRDDMKLDTPEARSMVRLLNDYEPHVMMDLHTTNGSRHAYHLTFETPNNPAVDPAIVEQSREWMGRVTQDASRPRTAGIFAPTATSPASAPERVWTTVEDLPRYTHNYWGIRNGFGILSETYSYLTFADRVTTARRFVEEVLNDAHANAKRILDTTAAARQRSLVGQQVSVRSKVKRGAQKVEIVMGDIEEDVNPYSGRVMHKRIDVRKPEQMWEEATFESTDSERVPTAYFVPASEKAAIERLRAHGIVLEPVPQATTRADRGVSDCLDRSRGPGVREPSGAHRHGQVGGRRASHCCRRRSACRCRSPWRAWRSTCSSRDRTTVSRPGTCSTRRSRSSVSTRNVVIVTTLSS